MAKLSREEINRKLLHVLSGTMIPAGIFYLPWVPGVPRFAPVVILGAVFVGFVVVEALRFRVDWVHRTFHALAAGALRPHEHERLTGATYIFASGFLCAVLFFRIPHIAFMALSMFILGDAAAALIGQALGRIRIGGKTLEGALGCFGVGMVLCFLVFPQLPGLLDAWGGRMPAAIAVVASVSTALLELFPVKVGRDIVVNDNLVVPVLSGVVIQCLHSIHVWLGK